MRPRTDPPDRPGGPRTTRRSCPAGLAATGAAVLVPALVAAVTLASCARASTPGPGAAPVATGGLVLTRSTDHHLVVLDVQRPPDGAADTRRVAVHVFRRTDGGPERAVVPVVTLTDRGDGRITELASGGPAPTAAAAAPFTADVTLATGRPFTLRVTVAGEDTEFTGSAP